MVHSAPFSKSSISDIHPRCAEYTAALLRLYECFCTVVREEASVRVESFKLLHLSTLHHSSFR
ncbi:hypothetical protein SCHPADRAFT_675300 [Schizopora paradoxa]|uniref:Uncharacterized protein n=1 Tax=Schizopora paradoxa TaxID=27342 RepID=A0A0H2RBN5_9AGAM|nr:hypothetical protein SCHPADRAFT_675300 [Schizopora paradoxa]